MPFAFERQPLESSEARVLIKRFAESPPYRSAAVDELESHHGAYRRPLRPEDLDFLKFQRPIRRETVFRLPSLATQRLLFCLHERQLNRWPDADATNARADYAALFTPEMDEIAAKLHPFLSRYGFHFAMQGADRFDKAPADMVSMLLDGQIARANAIMQHARRAGFVEGAARFVLTQVWLLLPMQQAALAFAEASGTFDALPEALHPFKGPDLSEHERSRALCAKLGVEADDHRYWQFYLASSLARSNLLWVFADTPLHAFRLWGAAFAAEADFLAAGCLLGQAAQELGLPTTPPADGGGAATLGRRFEEAVSLARQRFGDAAADEVRHGFAITAELADTAMHDLGLQLEWLSQIDSFRTAAALIENRIAAERPDIDRDTFVEPRDMCSTTHVHNEHRLVSIESGDMIFWGNVGMRLDLHKGDRILIPDGRLHGSTVTSPECTYHQPIIPDEWVADALGQINFLRMNP